MLITRTITAATVLISWPGHLGLFSLYWVAFLKDYVFTLRQLPQLWRLVTAFCITGPQLGLIMDPFFFWQYSNKLENGNPRFSQPGAYAVYLFFNAVIILVSASFFGPRSTKFFCTSHPSIYLPGQFILAVTVPGIEENCPLHCGSARHSQILKSVVGV